MAPRKKRKRTRTRAANPVEAVSRPRRRTSAARLVALATGLALVAVLMLGSGAGRVLFAEEVELTSAAATREVVPGGTASLTLHLHAKHALQGDEWFFVHVESEGGGPGAFHTGHDGPPEVPASQWWDRDIDHVVSIPFASSAAIGRYPVFVGLYDREKGTRLPLLEPRAADRRVLAAWIDVVAHDADGSTRTFTEGQIHRQTAIGPFRGMMAWLVAMMVAAAAAGWIAVRRYAVDDPPGPGSDPSLADDRATRWLRRIVYLSPAVPFVLGILVVLEFVKDDAY